MDARFIGFTSHVDLDHSMPPGPRKFNPRIIATLLHLQ